ncbi:hypothetical protein P7C70_g6995, partial [Phenoliferia sp. Uapishka_3]
MLPQIVDFRVLKHDDFLSDHAAILTTFTCNMPPNSSATNARKALAEKVKKKRQLLQEIVDRIGKNEVNDPRLLPPSVLDHALEDLVKDAPTTKAAHAMGPRSGHIEALEKKLAEHVAAAKAGDSAHKAALAVLMLDGSDTNAALLQEVRKGNKLCDRRVTRARTALQHARSWQKVRDNPESLIGMWKSNAADAAATQNTTTPIEDHLLHQGILGKAWDRPNHTEGVRAQAAKDENEADTTTANSDAHPLHRRLSLEEVKAALKDVKGRQTASGEDKVSWATIAQLDPASLQQLFQLCIDTCDTPHEWQLATICPIGKPTTIAGDPTTYRGISLESCLLKLLMTIITARVAKWADDSKILPDCQQGFRKHYRTENAPFILHTVLQKARFQEKDIHVAFVDLEKAFDTVCRDLLWTKMRGWGASGAIFDLIRKIYANMHAVVRADGVTSDAIRNDLGVLQGDPLSGLLWTLYIADILLAGTGNSPRISGILTNLLLMADDIALLAYSREELEGLLTELDQYCNDNLLTISIKKTVTLSIIFSGAAGDPDACTEIITNGQAIAQERFAKYIGICFETADPLSYNKQLLKQINTGAFFARQLMTLQTISCYELDVLEMRDFYCTHIGTRVLFGSAITFACDAELMETLERSFLRRLLELPDSSCTQGLYMDLGMYPIQMLRVESAIQFFIYASSISAPVLVRAALRDNMNLPRRATQRNPSWWASLLGEAKGYNVQLPHSVPINGLRQCASPVATLDEERKALLCVKRDIKQNMERMERKRLFNGLANTARFVNFIQKEATWGFKNYLTVLPHAIRVLYTRLRFSNHHLAIEKGRQVYPQIQPQGRRVCRLCNTLAIEDPVHMLGNCLGSPAIVAARYTFMDDLLQLPISNGREALGRLHWDDPMLWRYLWHSQDIKIIKLFGPYQALCFRTFYAVQWRQLGITEWNRLVMRQDGQDLS